MAVFFGTAIARAETLTIERAWVQRFVDGPPVLKPDTFVAGEDVHFSVRLKGFTRAAERVKTSLTARVTDPDGTPIVPPLSARVDETLSAEDKEWLPKLRGSFTLPGTLFTGEYTISIQAKDEPSGATVTRDLHFEVAGAAAAKSAELSIQNLQFYRKDDDDKPLEVAAYRPGEAIHARFWIAGYRHTSEGALDVTYGVTLADSTGAILYRQPVAARDASADFYPKPFISGSLSLTLKPDTEPGEFRLTISAHDGVGKATTEVSRTFRLE